MHTYIYRLTPFVQVGCSAGLTVLNAIWLCKIVGGVVKVCYGMSHVTCHVMSECLHTTHTCLCLEIAWHLWWHSLARLSTWHTLMTHTHTHDTHTHSWHTHTLMTHTHTHDTHSHLSPHLLTFKVTFTCTSNTHLSVTNSII